MMRVPVDHAGHESIICSFAYLGGNNTDVKSYNRIYALGWMNVLSNVIISLRASTWL